MPEWLQNLLAGQNGMEAYGSPVNEQGNVDSHATGSYMDQANNRQYTAIYGQGHQNGEEWVPGEVTGYRGTDTLAYDGLNDAAGRYNGMSYDEYDAQGNRTGSGIWDGLSDETQIMGFVKGVAMMMPAFAAAMSPAINAAVSFGTNPVMEGGSAAAGGAMNGLNGSDLMSDQFAANGGYGPGGFGSTGTNPAFAGDYVNGSDLMSDQFAANGGNGAGGFGGGDGSVASGIDPTNYSNEGNNYPTPESTQGPGGSPINSSIDPTNSFPDYSNEGHNYPDEASTQGPGGSPVNSSIDPANTIPEDYSHEGNNYPTEESTQGPGGSPVNAGGGSPPISVGSGTTIPGAGTGSGDGFNWGNLANLLSGLADANSQQHASDDMLAWLNGQQAKIDNLYNPNTPEYNALWDEMSRKDAAAGRNSQYGPRSVDLAARIAQVKADNTAKLTTGIGNTYAAAINRGASANSGLYSALGNLFGNSPTGGWNMNNITSGLSSLSNLFG